MWCVSTKRTSRSKCHKGRKQQGVSKPPVSEIIGVGDAEAKRHDIEIGDNGCGDARQQQPL